MENREPAVIENEFYFQDGSAGWFDLKTQPAPEGILILSSDITSQVMIIKMNELAREVLTMLTTYTDSVAMINSIIKIIRKRTGYEAVAIRLKEGDDYPYFATSGFDDKFVKMERYLCSRDKDGNLIYDNDGKPMLDCMCGNILPGRVDPAKSYFTEGRSFISGNTTWLLATTTPEERLARTINRYWDSGSLSSKNI